MQLGKVLKKWRVMSDLDLRTAAELMGLNSAATLIRIEQGREPSATNLMAIFRWLADKEHEEAKAG